jgi:hypothetical protein
LGICHTLEIPVVSPHIRQALSSYSPVDVECHVVDQLDGRILSLISDYEAAGVSYKEEADLSEPFYHVGL